MHKSEIKFITAMLIGCLLIFFLGHAGFKEECNQKSVSFDGNQYGILSGCMVSYKGRWIPLDNFRIVND